MHYRLVPSILSANFSRLGDDVKKIDKITEGLHIDIMDGHFVPNLTIGPAVVEALRPLTDAFFEVHLMISNPEAFIDAFAEAGADLICVHTESTFHLHRLLQSIRRLGKKVGVTINPATPIEMILPIIEDVDLVLLMSVNPGFGGQKFIPSVLPKIRRLREIIDSEALPVELEVDGGVGPQNLAEIIAAGANVFVAGNAVFGKSSPEEAVAELKRIIEQEGSNN